MTSAAIITASVVIVAVAIIIAVVIVAVVIISGAVILRLYRNGKFCCLSVAASNPASPYSVTAAFVPSS